MGPDVLSHYLKAPVQVQASCYASGSEVPRVGGHWFGLDGCLFLMTCRYDRHSVFLMNQNLIGLPEKTLMTDVILEADTLEIGLVRIHSALDLAVGSETAEDPVGLALIVSVSFYPRKMVVQHPHL